MVRAAEPECGAALRWLAVERCEALGAEAARAADEVMGELPTSAHVVIANELLDNLPFRLLRRTTAGWDELFVVDGEPVWAECDEMPPFDAPVGATAPWQREAAAWVEEALATGAARVVCLDYGDTTARLAARPWREWVRTHSGHAPGTEPWRSPGRQDITCEVAWDQLPGAPVVTTQADWLRRHGIDALVEEGRAVWHERAHLGDLAAVAARSRVGEAAALTDPDGMGAFLVLEWH
jgi:SAM-dependent MidA family methyltransferase